MAEFRAVFFLEGFDDNASPKWQMVPVGGERYVALRAGTGLTVACNAPNVVTVQEIPVAQLPSSGRTRRCRAPPAASSRAA